MDLAYYVTANQKLIDDIKSRTPGQDDVDMYYGTLDYATARFHTILIKISQDSWQAKPNKLMKDFNDSIQVWNIDLKNFLSVLF